MTRVPSTFFTLFRLVCLLSLLCPLCPDAAGAQVVSYAFVPNSSGPTKVTVIDTTTHTVFPTNITTAPAVAAVPSPDGGVVYVIATSATIEVLDVVTKTVIASIPVGNAPQARTSRRSC